MHSNLKGFLEHFFALEIIPGKKARIPYWQNKFYKDGKRIQGPLGGKGTPAEIKKAILSKAKENKVDLTQLSSEQIRSFMKQKKIGLDCSGFAFQVLNYLKPGFYRGLKKAEGRSLNPIRRFNAKVLTSKENSKRVEKTKDLKVGDLIPVSFDDQAIDHVMIIVGISKKEIIYAHSSSKGKITGPHLGKIKITSPEEVLEKQLWLEKTKQGLRLLEFACQPLKNLGVRRVGSR